MGLEEQCTRCEKVVSDIERIFKKQEARDIHVEDMHRDINSRVSARLFFSR